MGAIPRPSPSVTSSASTMSVAHPTGCRSRGLPRHRPPSRRQMKRQARGATLYVTLEPCCHLNKRTPPCVPLIIASGIKRIVVAMRDPNPQVRGRGLAALRRAKLQVNVGVGAEEAERLLEPYRRLITTRRPFVTLKVAATLGGQNAPAKGESRWGPSPPAPKMVPPLP